MSSKVRASEKTPVVVDKNKKPNVVPTKKAVPVFSVDDFVKPGLSREEVVEVKKAFDVLDEDNSGSIDPKELKDAFKNLGLLAKDKVIYQILGELDDDFSGGIEFPEFLKIATSKLSDKDSREDIEKVFNYYDWDGSGKITVNELKKIAEYLGEEMTEEELVAMFAKADLDNDGFVTKEDFYNIMTGNGYY